MAKRSTVKNRKTTSPQPKATTFRIDPSVRRKLMLLQSVLNKPLNRLVNEALEDFVEKRTAEVETDLLQILMRLRKYRRSDPKFEKAIAQFVNAEASLGSDDPVEGRTRVKAGPAQTMVQKLLRG